MAVSRMRRDVAIAYALIVVTSLIANFNLVPVYVHMMIVTCATIYIGSYGSLKSVQQELGQVSETMQTKDAMMFPVIGSVVLFSLFLVFKYLPQYYVNLVIKAYFFLFGLLVLGQRISTILSQLLPEPIVNKFVSHQWKIPDPTAWISLPWGNKEEKQPEPAAAAATDANAAAPAAAGAVPAEQSGFEVTGLDLIALFFAALIVGWYGMTGHWAASNLFGMAFSIQGIEMLALGSYKNGAILLSGLFFYDIFWVFYTPVMVSVAKSFDAPIKLLFPQTDAALRPSMLGLGDIVIPGIFIALMLRFDVYLAEQAAKKKQEDGDADAKVTVNPVYFHSTLVSYFLGLTTTVLVMYAFQHAQPALLYLVPACLGSTLLTGALRSQFWLMAKFEEEEIPPPAAEVAVEAKKEQ